MLTRIATRVGLCVLVSFSYISRSAFAQFATNRYAVFLADPPVAERFAGRAAVESPAATSYRQQVETRQRDVIRELGARNFHITGSVSTLLNAVFVIATPD